MSWYNAIIEKLVEANPVEQAPLQEVKLFFQQLSEKIGQLYIEMGNAEGLIEQPQLFWKLLLILKENRGDFNSLKKNILDAIYQDLRNAPLEANQWQAFYQPFDIAFDNENLAEVELDDRIENLESLFELEQQEEINEQVARDFYAQRMAILLIKNGLPGKPSSFQNVSVSRCEALFNILLHMDSYDVDEVSKKNLFQLFEMFCQMDLIANSASWDALKEKLQVEQQAEKFNAFCELLFNYEGKNNFLKYLLNNDVLTNIEWLDENKGLFEEEDPIKAMNLALTNTDNIDFNQKVKQLVEIASEKNAKIYVGQLKCFFPHYLDDFERLYQQITSEHDFVQDKGLNALKYYQTAVFLLQEDEYYQKCLNFFSNIDLSTYFDSSEVDLYAMETRTFFDEKEIGADERLRIHELIVRRLLSEVDEEKFNLIKFCHHHLNPELPKQPLEFSLNDSQHLAKVDVLFDEVTADEITPIAWNQETLTFCYQYMLQHMAGLKNIAQWDNLQLDDLMQSINLLETEQHKINVMAVLSGFHAYLLKTERAVTNEKLTNAFDALNNLCQQPYPDLETLIGINNSCPDLLGFVTKTDCLQFANDNQVCLFMASIRNVVETAKLEQSVHVKVKALLENFDVYISNSENVFRFSEINQAKEYIRQQMISRGNPIHFDKALKSWLKQLDEETELNFQLAHLRAELVFEQRIEQLDSMQQERFKKGVKLLVAGTNPLSEVSGRVVEQAYKELYEAINAPAEYEEFRQQQNETPFIVRLAQSYSSKSSLPVQEKYAIQALNKIAESIFQINDQALATNNPYQLRGTAGVKRTYTYQQAQGGSKTLRITSTMDRMMGIIDEVCRGKITARNAHAQIMTIGEKACRKHHILDDAEFDPNNGVDKKKAIYLMAKKGEFIDNKALLATEKLCKDYCLQVKAEIEAGPWAIAFGIGTRVGGQRISPTMVKMRDIIKGADRGKTSWESAYHFIHRQANLAMDRRSSPRFDINLFSCGKKDPALLYKKIQKVNLLCGSDDAIEKLLESVGKEIQGVLEQADWGNGFKKTLRSLFGGKTIVFNGHEYKHRPEHLAKAVAYYHAYQMKSIDGRVALDGIRAVFQQASASKTWLRSQGMHSFYQQQAKELGAALAPPIVPNQF